MIKNYPNLQISDYTVCEEVKDIFSIIAKQRKNKTKSQAGNYSDASEDT